MAAISTPLIARYGLRLKGTLDVQDQNITTNITNGNISILPNGTGHVNLGSLKFPNNIGSNHQCLVTDTSGNLTWANVGFYDLTTFSTDDLAEGANANRKYYSNTLFNSSFSLKTTNDLTEGTTNKYYHSSLFNSDLASKTTTNLTEGDNLYWTQDRFNTALSGKTSDDVAEGTTNKYFNDTYFSTSLAASSIDGLSDVVITKTGNGAVANNHGLVYDGTSSNWINKKLGSAAFVDTGTSAGNLVLLNSGGKLPDEVMPPLAINETFIVTTIADRNGLTAEKGDVAIVTGTVNKTYIYDGASWQEIVTYYSVKSVNTEIGDVVLTANKIDAALTPTGYSTLGSKIEQHLTGINNKLANFYINDLYDVAITNPASGNTLAYIGSQWKNVSSISENSITYVSPNGSLYADGATGTIYQPFSKIQDAIDNGTGIIRLAPGTYTENITFSTGTVKIEGSPFIFDSPTAIISGKVTVSGGSVSAKNIGITNTASGASNDCLVITGCTGQKHIFENVKFDRGNATYEAVKMSGASSAYDQSGVNVVLENISCIGSISHLAATEVLIRNLKTSSSITQNNTSGCILKIYDSEICGDITHTNGKLYIENLKNVTVKAGNTDEDCIISTATLQTYNYFSLNNVNLLLSTGTKARINKSGDCDWELTAVNRNLGNDVLNGANKKNIRQYALDIESSIDAQNDISHYAPRFGNSDIYSHLRGIDTALGNLSSSNISNTIFDYAGDLIVGTGNDTYQRLGKGSNGQLLSISSGVVAWADPPPPAFVDPTTSRGDIIYRNTTGTNGTTTRLPIGTAGQFLKVLNVSTGQIGWSNPNVLKDDTSPTLGGNLNIYDGANPHDITTSQTDGNIKILPNGSGKLLLDSLWWPNTDGTNGQAIFTDGNGNLVFGDIPAVGVTSVNGKSGSSVTIDGSDINTTHTAVNYTVAGAKIDQHLTGIDTLLGAIPGANVTTNRPSPTNWTVLTNTLNGHLAGLDSALGSMKIVDGDIQGQLNGIDVLTTKGDILYQSASGTYNRLPIGTTDYVLTVKNGLPTWSIGGMENVLTTNGDIIVRIGGKPDRLGAGVDNNDKVLTVVAGIPAWQDLPPPGFTWPGTTEGDMIYHHSGSPTRFPAGTGNNGKYLKVVAGVPVWSDGVSSVNSQTGSVTLNGDNLTTAVTPVNYSASDAKIDTHISGLDTSIGTQKGRIDNIRLILPTFTDQIFTLVADDITNGYIDLTHLMLAKSSFVIVSGLIHMEGTDYTVSTESLVSRITFAGDLASILKAGDKVYVKYAYVVAE